MRAMQFDEYGEPGVIHLADREEPHAGPGEIRISVRAAGVNPMDWKIRSGAMASMMPVALPHVPGLDGSGVVDEVGDGVTGVEVGDRVFGNGTATTAEYAVLKRFARIPESLDFAQAAALPVPVETAVRILDALELSEGDTIVVDGAAGGVGTAVVQVAVARGLVVIGTASEHNHEHLRSLGATPTTYGAGLVDRVHDLTDAPIAGGLDLVGHGSLPDLISLTGDPDKVITIADFSAGELGVTISTGAAPAVHALDEVSRLVDEGRFTVVVEDVLPWTDASVAHERSQAGHVRGKLVLVVD
jgi:NADPH:quinone reductase-like Zn-dependent oxidoreductase